MKPCGNPECSHSFNPKYTAQTFCSVRCSAIYNNKKYPKRHAQRTICKCGKKISKQSTVCRECSIKQKIECKIQSWLDGTWSGAQDKNPYILSKWIRNYLLEQNNFKCSVCNFNTPHPDDGRSILEINHIDGIASNHSPDNLEVLCPNHHALTSSYRGRNLGNGRPSRYKVPLAGIEPA